MIFAITLAPIPKAHGKIKSLHKTQASMRNILVGAIKTWADLILVLEAMEKRELSSQIRQALAKRKMSLLTPLHLKKIRNRQGQLIGEVKVKKNKIFFKGKKITYQENLTFEENIKRMGSLFKVAQSSPLDFIPSADAVDWETAGWVTGGVLAVLSVVAMVLGNVATVFAFAMLGQIGAAALAVAAVIVLALTLAGKALKPAASGLTKWLDEQTRDKTLATVLHSTSMKCNGNTLAVTSGKNQITYDSKNKIIQPGSYVKEMEAQEIKPRHLAILFDFLEETCQKDPKKLEEALAQARAAVAVAPPAQEMGATAQ